MKKNPGTLKNIIFINLKILEAQHVDYFRKEAHRRMMKIRLNNLQNHGYEINVYAKIGN